MEEITVSQRGAFCIGFLLGWLLYYINRHRTGEVSLADFGTIVGVLGGAAVLGLIGDGKTANPTLVGYYGVGLMSGFVTYLVVLLLLVRFSKGEYDMLFFLDGRRRKPAPGYEVPEPSVVRPFSVLQPQQLVLDHGTRGASQIVVENLGSRSFMSAQPESAEEIRAAIDRMIAATHRLGEEQANEPDAAKRDAINDMIDELNRKTMVLQALLAQLDFNRPAVKAAQAQLSDLAKSLKEDAQQMEAAAKAFDQAAIVLSAAEKLISFASGLG